MAGTSAGPVTKVAEDENQGKAVNVYFGVFFDVREDDSWYNTFGNYRKKAEKWKEEMVGDLLGSDEYKLVQLVEGNVKETLKELPDNPVSKAILNAIDKAENKAAGYADTIEGYSNKPGEYIDKAGNKVSGYANKPDEYMNKTENKISNYANKPDEYMNKADNKITNYQNAVSSYDDKLSMIPGYQELKNQIWGYKNELKETTGGYKDELKDTLKGYKDALMEEAKPATDIVEKIKDADPFGSKRSIISKMEPAYEGKKEKTGESYNYRIYAQGSLLPSELKPKSTGDDADDGGSNADKSQWSKEAAETALEAIKNKIITIPNGIKLSVHFDIFGYDDDASMEKLEPELNNLKQAFSNITGIDIDHKGQYKKLNDPDEVKSGLGGAKSRFRNTNFLNK
ncbi:MAG: hypothetical protein FWG84_06840 [Bacteroidales bacterium]|nr:hypothetical protein [Bacteroidales bacterium]